jgi:hypothetical protein
MRCKTSIGSMRFGTKRLGYEVVDKKSTPAESQYYPPSDAEKIIVAKMEHYRWVAERLMRGWRWGSNRERDERGQLCAWETLEKDPQLRKELDKDIQQIELLNQEIIRRGCSFQPFKREHF